LLHNQCWGYDISEYALAHADVDVRQFLSNNINYSYYDMIIAKDVLEHIPYENIEDVLKKIAEITRRLFCIIPMGNLGKYIVPTYELDKTHIIKENLDWWLKKFYDCGFTALWANYSMPHIKQNYKKWKKGNGFFLLRSN